MPWDSYAQTSDLYEIAYSEGFDTFDFEYEHPKLPIGQALADLGMSIIERPRNRGEFVGFIVTNHNAARPMTYDGVSVIERPAQYVEVHWCSASNRYRRMDNGRFVSASCLTESWEHERSSRFQKPAPKPEPVSWSVGDLCQIDGEVGLVASVLDGTDYVELLIEHGSGALESHWVTTDQIKPLS